MHLPTCFVRAFCLAATLTLGVHLGIAQEASRSASPTPLVELDTTEGRIVIELNAEQAPKTVANFLEYAASGHYEGTVFHCVIPNFMIQCGGLDESLREKATKPPIRNESANGLTHKKYTVAMARRMDDPHSATCQFFINTADNDAQGSSGYAVFGKVINGFDVVDKIGSTQTHARPNPAVPELLMQDVPVTPIVIKRVTVISKTAS